MKKLRHILAASSFPLAVAACASAPVQDAAAVEIQFEVRVGEQALHCGHRFGPLGSSSAAATLQDFRVYVSRLRLIAADGHEQDARLVPDNMWQSDRVALLDFEDATGDCNGNVVTNTIVRAQAPAGDYRGLAFDIGVPPDLNHQDPTIADAPLNFSALTWPWRYGYRFTTIDLETTPREGASTPTHAATGFSVHLGSVDCGEGSPSTPPASPCATQNRPSFRLPNFNPSRHVVVLDLGALLADTDVTVNAPETPSGCMSSPNDADCVAIMEHLGLTFGGKPSAGQRFVRAAPANGG